MAVNRNKKSLDKRGSTVTFEDLRGLLKGAFDDLGGGEAFLRGERRYFYGRSRRGKDNPARMLAPNWRKREHTE
jgi:hypothetical protein